MITKTLFGKLPCGCEVYAYQLTNKSITSARILNYGGIIQSLCVEDRNGVKADVVCGYDCIEGYLTSGGYQGALIGRIGNRIAKGKFTLEGVEYQLTCNDGSNTLHGGKFGFNSKIWAVEEAGTEDEPALVLSYVSPDGEENYPGTLTVKVTYTLTADAGLSIHYEATADKTTIVNLTNHAYFNMGGFASGVVDDQLLWLDCDKINSIDSELIPDGELVDVTGTCYDFRNTMALGTGFAGDHPMMKEFGGYDNNFCFANPDGKLQLRGSLTDPKSGRKLNMYTDQPCVQIYTANMIDVNDHPFKGDVKQYRHCACCLETQCMPDSINHPNFTNVVLKPGEKYDTTTIYKFEN
ncbi:MAG: galactose mutarotase [Clostridia bacterium]|nr:galactose mutarotase [Clostridia bacterium]